ncbi:MAG: sulfotransferase family 2 domain-containing protein, partial [Rubripirellula sp.]
MIKQVRNGLTAIRDEYVYRKHSPGRVLFDHLPKCAGSAIDTYLGSHYPQRLVFKTDPNQPRSSIAEFREMSSEERFRYRLVVGHMAHDLVDLVHPETTTLTILREPIDRIVSHYYYVLQQEQHYLHERVVNDNIQLEEYSTLALSEELRNWYTTHFTGLLIEQVDQDPDAALQHAVEVIAEKYDIVGFQTNL